MSALEEALQMARDRGYVVTLHTDAYGHRLNVGHHTRPALDPYEIGTPSFTRPHELGKWLKGWLRDHEDDHLHTRKGDTE